MSTTEARKRRVGGWGFEGESFSPSEPLLAWLQRRVGAAGGPVSGLAPPPPSSPRDLPELPLEVSTDAMDRLAHAVTIGLPEDSFKRQLDELNREKIDLDRQREELLSRITNATQVDASIEGIENFCALARQNLASFGYAEKRLALDALSIKVWVDGNDLTIEGAIPDIDCAVLSTPLSSSR